MIVWSPAMSADAAERLKAAPAVQRVPTPKLDLYRRRDFLDPDECAAIIAHIDRNRQPSTIVDDYGGENNFRTSETSHFDGDDVLIDTINRRLSDFLGIDAVFGEPMQGQRYAAGQEFKAHTDYFDPGGAAMREIRATAGQRTWTAMIYLNAPDAGGATRFKVIRKSIQPQTGTLLVWNNLKADGTVNSATLHHGMKVRAGVKYIITKWFCERPWSPA
ncbi:2OG-Fe(II) oxygenase [Pacificimonas sp. WHA3]|uniref:2OG-Fe(II) oxygenase n=1 Tax=Pacificimonas pallii TaxID=2827236 RepID=A0ABS6SDN0_9SPHN|nr:2OG-Fe(II) oxygenase [Pacificimonas pallii]MBV7256514.1 2OG-Fe(II) oxygenase [Pacificimonas pallii]